MDSFAGSEPREFISFYLGKEANGQPARAWTENSDISAITEAINSNAVQETAGTDSVEGTSASIKQPLPQTCSHEILPSDIEIIEDVSSQASSDHECFGRPTVNLPITRDLASQLPQSPDYSPFMIIMLASDYSSSGESVQAYFARKIRSREGEETSESAISGTLPPLGKVKVPLLPPLLSVTSHRERERERVLLKWISPT